MAWKWFNNIFKIIILSALTIILGAGCSSSSQKKSYTSQELEKRADEYLSIGDRFRLQGRSADALQYYRSAQNIYFKKWNSSKYTLAGMKETTVLVLQGDLVLAKERLEYFKNYAQNMGVTDILADIALSEAMLLYSSEKNVEATTLLDNWCERDDIKLEKRQYMLFYRIWKSMELPKNMTVEDLMKEGRSIISKYFSGELENQEVAFFSTLALAEFLEHKQQYNEAWTLLNQVVDIHRDSEVTIQWPRIFSALSRVATKLNRPELAAFYHRMYEEQLKVPLL